MPTGTATPEFKGGNLETRHFDPSELGNKHNRPAMQRSFLITARDGGWDRIGFLKRMGNRLGVLLFKSRTP
jgi:hypothetical protein